MNAQHRDPRPKRRSILFSAPMVRAILAGEKTVTRRVVKPQPPVDTDYVSADEDPRGRGALCVSGVEGGEFAEGIDPWRRCPYGAPGDHLWVRETWRPDASHDPDDTIYRADVCAERIAEFDGIVKWHSSRFMPRVRSRITLDVVSVRVERLCSLDDADAIREGIPAAGDMRPFARFADLWDSINGKRAPWASDPWVWRIEFKRVEAQT